MGKSGAGKSTLLSLISGLDLCTSGAMLFEGRDMKTLDRDCYRAKSIGVIFQGYNLLTNATALENILLSMNISGSRRKNKKEYALQILEKVGIHQEIQKKILWKYFSPWPMRKENVLLLSPIRKRSPVMPMNCGD